MKKLGLLLLAGISLGLSSCNAPLVKQTLSMPGNVVRGAAHATGFGGVGGL